MERKLGLPSIALPFEDLAELRDLAKQILDASDESLSQYLDRGSGGYFHVLDPDFRGTGTGNHPGDYSKATTATVVRYLVETGERQAEPKSSNDQSQFDKLLENAGCLFDKLLAEEKWQSAGLAANNPFTVGFMLELAGDLYDLRVNSSRKQSIEIEQKQAEVLRDKLEMLHRSLVDGGGSIAIEKGLPNAYCTQLATRVLDAWDRRIDDDKSRNLDLLSGTSWFSEDAQELTRTWAMAAVDAEIALAASAPHESDVFELGYAVLLVLRFPLNRADPSSLRRPNPIERRRLERAFDLVFAAQSEDGTWPQSRRLFHYPTYGNAYCHEYEFLTQLLDKIDDPLHLRPYLPHFRRAIDRLVREVVHLPNGGFGWLSGHHRQLKWPESWSTASCFHFAHLLDRFVADAVRDLILQHLDTRPSRSNMVPDPRPFDGILDSSFRVAGIDTPLKGVLREKLIDPVAKQRDSLRNGGRLSTGTPLSAILYGPPGTSKTEYVSAIAAKIGWPLISIDPSHLMRHGISNILPEMNQVFKMLNYAENVVVFFDEIDELVRDRSGVFEESASRFLTTAMLPKIAKLREGRHLLFFVATNHLEVFDSAIARPGRFDIIVPVMPPTVEEKLREWRGVADAISQSGIVLSGKMRRQIASLTHAEFRTVATGLSECTDKDRFKKILVEAFKSCTLQSKIDKDKTWAILMDEQSDKLRVP